MRRTDPGLISVRTQHEVTENERGSHAMCGSRGHRHMASLDAVAADPHESRELQPSISSDSTLQLRVLLGARFSQLESLLASRFHITGPLVNSASEFYRLLREASAVLPGHLQGRELISFVEGTLLPRFPYEIHSTFMTVRGASDSFPSRGVPGRRPPVVPISGGTKPSLAELHPESCGHPEDPDEFLKSWSSKFVEYKDGLQGSDLQFFEALWLLLGALWVLHCRDTWDCESEWYWDEDFCGPNQYGNYCKTCGPGQACYQGDCCTQDCDGKECGSDGCGGSCGSCDDPYQSCNEGACEYLPGLSGDYTAILEHPTLKGFLALTAEEAAELGQTLQLLDTAPHAALAETWSEFDGLPTITEAQWTTIWLRRVAVAVWREINLGYGGPFGHSLTDYSTCELEALIGRGVKSTSESSYAPDGPISMPQVQNQTCPDDSLPAPLGFQANGSEWDAFWSDAEPGMIELDLGVWAANPLALRPGDNLILEPWTSDKDLFDQILFRMAPLRVNGFYGTGAPQGAQSSHPNGQLAPLNCLSDGVFDWRVAHGLLKALCRAVNIPLAVGRLANFSDVDITPHSLIAFAPSLGSPGSPKGLLALMAAKMNTYPYLWLSAESLSACNSLNCSGEGIDSVSKLNISASSACNLLWELNRSIAFEVFYFGAYEPLVDDLDISEPMEAFKDLCDVWLSGDTQNLETSTMLQQIRRFTIEPYGGAFDETGAACTPSGGPTSVLLCDISLYQYMLGLSQELSPGGLFSELMGQSALLLGYSFEDGAIEVYNTLSCGTCGVNCDACVEWEWGKWKLDGSGVCGLEDSQDSCFAKIIKECGLQT